MRDGDMKVGLVDDLWQTIPSAWVEAAQERYRKRKREQPHAFTGIDPSQGGKDNEAICMIYGHRFEVHDHKGIETPDGKHTVAHLNRAYAAHEGNPNAVIGVDAIGYGADALGRLKDLYNSVYPINSGGRAKGKDKTGKFGFVSLRAKMYWELREDLAPDSGLELELPDDPELLADLTAPLYEITATGIKVEPKERLKKRIGRSPGKGDAVVYANHMRRYYRFSGGSGFGVFTSG